MAMLIARLVLGVAMWLAIVLICSRVSKRLARRAGLPGSAPHWDSTLRCYWLILAAAIFVYSVMELAVDLYDIDTEGLPRLEAWQPAIGLSIFGGIMLGPAAGAAWLCYRLIWAARRRRLPDLSRHLLLRSTLAFVCVPVALYVTAGWTMDLYFAREYQQISSTHQTLYTACTSDEAATNIDWADYIQNADQFLPPRQSSAQPNTEPARAPRPIGVGVSNALDEEHDIQMTSLDTAEVRFSDGVLESCTTYYYVKRDGRWRLKDVIFYGGFD